MRTLIFACFFGFSSADIVVNTISGPVKGIRSLVEGINAFLGIPYAEAPIGKLRFAKPVQHRPWNTTYNATDFPPPCAQFSIGIFYFMPDLKNISEDCLYINLWVPRYEDHQDLRPIVIFIHGGIFSYGSTDMKVYDGSNLAKRGDMIVATISYRLGPFGFFLGNSKESPGNMGMHDQVMAIKWIKDNAVIFGGDPENIVLMGESAGAYSASLHMVSPLSKDLFRKAILQSGGMMPPYITDNARLFRNSQTVASLTGCENETVTLINDSHEVIECLRQKPVEDILEAVKEISPSMPFYPSIDDEFLPKSTINLLKEGKFHKDLSLLIGVNRDEGTMMVASELPDYFGRYGQDSVAMTKSRIIFLARSSLLLMNQKNPLEIIKQYLKNVKQRDSAGFTKMLSEIVGDFIISCGTEFLADVVSLKGNNVYFYKFDFKAASTPMAEWIGITHMDELQYVFGNPFHENFTDEETKFSNLLIDRWSAFAKTGDPNLPSHLPWLKYSYHNRLYIDFGQENESLRKDPLQRCEIWRNNFQAEFNTSLIRFLRNSGINQL